MNERTTNINGSPDPQLIRHGEGLVHLATPIDPDCPCVDSGKKLRPRRPSKTDEMFSAIINLRDNVHKTRRHKEPTEDQWSDILSQIDRIMEDHVALVKMWNATKDKSHRRYVQLRHINKHLAGRHNVEAVNNILRDILNKVSHGGNGHRDENPCYGFKKPVARCVDCDCDPCICHTIAGTEESK